MTAPHRELGATPGHLRHDLASHHSHADRRKWLCAVYGQRDRDRQPDVDRDDRRRHPVHAGRDSHSSGAPFATVSTTFTATDAAGNSRPPVASGTSPRSNAAACAHAGDHHRSGAAEGDAQLGLRRVLIGAPVTGYHVHVKGPQGLSDPNTGRGRQLPRLRQPPGRRDLRVLVDREGRLRRERWLRAPRAAERHKPAERAGRRPAGLLAATKAVLLAWIPSSDNIQIDHYQILRNGIPLGVTDASTFTDTDTGRLQAARRATSCAQWIPTATSRTLTPRPRRFPTGPRPRSRFRPRR